ncbi:MAG: septum formation initiator family protein [Patescibacteria group bacterium]
MRREGFFYNLKNRLESLLPMTLMSLLLFLLVMYFLYVVGKTTWDNYQSNQEIKKMGERIAGLEEGIKFMEYEINYYKTDSFKEKEAREKLGYRAPDEKVISLPLDKPEDKILDEPQGEIVIKTPNYRLWWKYFFGE